MEYIDLMRKNKLIYLNLDELASELNKLTNQSVENIKEVTLSLIDNGKLFLDDSGRISICADRGFFKAKITLNKKGYGFAQVDGFNDFFIPAFQINGAFDGDDCIVEITDMKSPENIEGKVVKVLKRNTTHVVGTYIVGKSKNVVLPDNEKLPQIRIYKGNALNAKNNEKVWVRLDEYAADSDVLTGSIIEVLGQANSPKVEQLSIIREHKLHDKFEESTINEALNIPQKVNKSKFKKRKDFTELLTITIDGEDARDFDDAISVEKKDNGYTFYVHIADVTHYVTEGSALDKEAKQRGTSVYFPNQVIPMLPKELSNGICSLNEGEDRLTVSVVMQFDKNLKFLSAEVFESIIKSSHRMTYTEIGAILEGDELLREKYQDVVEDILLYQKLSNVLKDERAKRGEIRFNLPEPYILENAEGEIVSIGKRMPDEPHEIIESLMLKANEVVAEYAYKHKLPIVYRVHEKPDAEKVTKLAVLLKAMGIANNLEQDGDKPIAYQQIMEKIIGTPKEKTLSVLALRTMMKARYAPTCLGHFGLASTYYCHFTSPIRRYPDLMVHRILKYALNGVPVRDLQDKYKVIVERVSDTSSVAEKNADEAEREVDDYKKALYMSKFLGEEFEATISGVQEYGLFVELDNGVEGLLKVDCLPFDIYEYDETKLSLVGKSHKYEIGDKIRVIVAAANTKARQIDFDLPGGGTIKDLLIDGKNTQNKKNKASKNVVKVINVGDKGKKDKNNKTNKAKQNKKQYKTTAKAYMQNRKKSKSSNKKRKRK